MQNLIQRLFFVGQSSPFSQSSPHRLPSVTIHHLPLHHVPGISDVLVALREITKLLKRHLSIAVGVGPPHHFIGLGVVAERYSIHPQAYLLQFSLREKFRVISIVQMKYKVVQITRQKIPHGYGVFLEIDGSGVPVVHPGEHHLRELRPLKAVEIQELFHRYLPFLRFVNLAECTPQLMHGAVFNVQLVEVLPSTRPHLHARSRSTAAHSM